MKIQTSRGIRADATIMRGGLLHIFCSLFLVAATVTAFGALASPRTSKGLAGTGNASPANIIVVTNTNDSGPGSLRNALTVANDGDTIDATGVSGTILLTSGELQINHNVTINGPGAANLAVNGNASSRVFENFASNVTISGFTITNGHPSTSDTNGGGGILNRGGLTLSGSSIVSNDAGAPIPPDTCNSGGGINTLSGTLTVTNSVISDNIGAGGGISADGATVTVSNSSINGNIGSGGPGGIGCFGTGTLTVMNSTITGNTAGRCGHVIAGWGGGIGCFDTVTLTVMNSTISGNSAGGDQYLGGAGVYNGGTLTVTNSTISSNFVYGPLPNDGYGGGIWNVGNLIVTSSTISGNSAPLGQGGAIFNSAGETMIEDTILNAGASGGTIFLAGGTATSLGYNLASDNGGGVLTGPGDQINTDPMLGPLQNNGGPTFTHALLPGSPAIDAGDPSFTPPPLYDQRGPGFDRVVNGRIDVGSFEVQTQIHLQASGRKVGGINTVRLTWSGATGANIDLYRNGALIVTTANDGSCTDSTGDTGRARYTYRVCEAGTDTCSNNASVTFRQ